MLSEQESKIGRALAGGHLPSFARAVVSHDHLCELVFSLILDRVDAESDTVCKRLPPSLFRKIPVSQLGQLEWKSCIDELHATAPSLLKIFAKITSHSDSRNMKKVDSAHFPGICVAAAVILKERNSVVPPLCIGT